MVVFKELSYAVSSPTARALGRMLLARQEQEMAVLHRLVVGTGTREDALFALSLVHRGGDMALLHELRGAWGIA